MSEQATPRPWAFVPANWEFHPHVVGPDGEYVGAGDGEADHHLIVEAVNNYDRLRAIEEAARLRRNVAFVGEDTPTFARGTDWVAIPREDFDRLRAALEGVPHDPE